MPRKKPKVEHNLVSVHVYNKPRAVVCSCSWSSKATTEHKSTAIRVLNTHKKEI